MKAESGKRKAELVRRACGLDICDRVRYQHMYRDGEGRVLFVSGISRGRFWGTFWRPRPWTLRRLIRQALPMRKSKGEALSDLNQYAADNGLQDICQGCH